GDFRCGQLVIGGQEVRPGLAGRPILPEDETEQHQHGHAENGEDEKRPPPTFVGADPRQQEQGVGLRPGKVRFTRRIRGHDSTSYEGEGEKALAVVRRGRVAAELRGRYIDAELRLRDAEKQPAVVRRYGKVDQTEEPPVRIEPARDQEAVAEPTD